MSGRAAKYKNLIIFGCLAYPHINQGKLDVIALKEVFVSYLDRVKRCKIWCKQHRSAISRDMTFNKAALIKEKVTSDTYAFANNNMDKPANTSKLKVEFSNERDHKRKHLILKMDYIMNLKKLRHSIYNKLTCKTLIS